ncbi:hypothetical protein M6B38_143245 [Iris pallida]|uniref:Uncharacterized protein n=1 Tax=Iris pallida TaxID=29817 RepID=A0AAX6FBG9_IRIPA|nr:hypothetical protein M6B38_143245 [Iris pallida]
MGGSESKPSSDSSTDREEGGGLYESQKSALKASAIAVGTAAVAGAALAWAAASKDASSSGDGDDGDNRMMKAPGRNGEYIRRRQFEDDPKKYFRNQRNKD